MKIGVVIPAKDEEAIIGKTLDSILAQSLKPEQIILVNDGSSDNTKQIALEKKIHVVDFKEKHKNWVGKKELSRVFNCGLEKLDHDLDYVTVIGSDEVIPENHLEFISNKMQEDNIMIASGIIVNDEPRTIPRGSGRLVDWRWWNKINGGRYPCNYGFESWLIAKADGKVKIYPEIKSTMQRPTYQNYSVKRFLDRGRAYRVLGYNRRFVLARSLKIFFKGNVMRSLLILLGYSFGRDELYGNDVRKYYQALQNKQTKLFRRNVV